MISVRGVMIVALITVCVPSIAQEASPPKGSHEVTMRQSEIDKTLQEIEPHAREYPVRFESAQQRRDMQDKLVRLLVFLDGAAKENADNPDVLIRDAVANGFGHNMGCPDCGEKAIAAYDQLLKLQPDSAEANWRYGGFLASTTQHEKAIPYLQKAASLGVVDAHYTAAMVFLGLNDLDHAKLELREYVKANPKDKAAKGLLADIEHGNLHIHIHDGPPPQDTAAPAPVR
jgi:tetratricopeptide (TPR) repeat protein